MIHSTKGLVLRCIAYGETSVIVQVLTELFGMQSYLVNGVRTSKKSAIKGQFFQPSAILDLEVYHHELKQLQRIKEVRWHYLYQHILFNVPKNAVALFMTELLQKALRQPEHNPDLYNFTEDAFIQLDKADMKTTAGYPLFFALRLASFLGFGIRDEFTPKRHLLDLREGEFTDVIPPHPNYLNEQLSATVSHLLKVMHPNELPQLQLSLAIRRELLEQILQFYALHIQDFGSMKTVPVLQQIL